MSGDGPAPYCPAPIPKLVSRLPPRRSPPVLARAARPPAALLAMALMASPTCVLAQGAVAPEPPPASASDPAVLPAIPSPTLRAVPRRLPVPSGDASRELPIVLEADRLSGSPDRAATAEGNVELRRGDLRLRADQLSYDVPGDRASASGHVQLDRGADRFTGSALEMQLQRFEGVLLEPTYFFSRTGAGGSARRLDVQGEQRASLAGATYSSCAPDGSGAPAWVLETEQVRLDFERNEGVAEGAVLRFYGVPLLAAPVLSFPLNDERKSGWLPPNLSIDSKSGVEMQAPYYWNIAPQYDATLTPTVSTRRGAGLDSEFRYLAPRDEGQLDLRLLPDDRVAGRSRYALDLRHAGGDARVLDYQARVVRVSDDDYWKDFPRNIGVLTPRLLPTDLRAGRRWEQGGDGMWTAYARLQRWQVLQDVDPSVRIVSPYERSPQLGVLQVGSAGALRWAAEAEYNRFTLPHGEALADPDRVTGQRLHVAGHVSVPYETPGWSLTPRLSLNAASYDLEQPLADGRRRATRFIPTFSLDSAWVLERDAEFFGRGVRQTLEPRLMYANTPYRAQDVLPNFDSAARDFNFDSIYAENSFSGIDRVSDSHQLTAGVTTRLIDPASGAEALRLGVVQRFLLRDQRITPEGTPLTNRFSDVLLLGSSRLVPKWTLDAALRYSPDIERSIRSIVGARYSPGPYRTIGATYRFARGLNEQIDVGWQWPVYRAAAPGARLAGSSATASACSGTWYSVGRVNFSTRDSRITDSLVGFEYDAGCWIGRFVAERVSTGRSEATTRLMLQLELVGLSRLGINPLAVLKDNIPGYRLLRDEADAPPGALTSE